ncbi:hypothetical protein [Salibacterium aidingense]|uniref:hypothetical protein n=1 Tax=Salibacterium aidingense TaxID=384933 RepID=UPI0004058054|nr:hypothetical protein [Salibacterium aidingense]
MQLTRLIILGVLILLFVSGCGSENGETSESGSSAESEDNKQETVEDNKVQDEQTRVYETDKGEVTIPENPERVAVAVQDFMSVMCSRWE